MPLGLVRHNLIPAPCELAPLPQLCAHLLACVRRLGLFSFLSESKIPGSVPFLKGVIPPYGGEYMAPFEGNFGF